MSTRHSDADTAVGFTVSRRALLGGAAAAGGALALGGVSVLGTSNAFAAATSAEDFQRLSQFLTGGKPLPAGLSVRFLEALTRHDKGFSASCAQLYRFLAASQARDIDALLARPDLSEPLRQTVTQIVSAWYLGIVGTDADAELISYAEALMYRPTLDVLVVPTYGGGPDSWGDKPAGISVERNGKQA